MTLRFAPILLVSILALPGPAQAQHPDPPVLKVEDAVLTALRLNPTLVAARRERNVALIQADSARPGFRPHVTLGVSNGFQSTVRDFLPRKTEDLLSSPQFLTAVGIALQMPLYQFGVGGAPGKRAEALAAAARSDYRKAELDTALQVRQAYLLVARTQALANVARRGAELARGNTRHTTDLRDQGLKADIDLLEAHRAEAEAESKRIEAENGVALASADLNRLLGRPVTTPFTVAAADLPADPTSLEELTARALAQRPEVSTLRSNIQAAEAGVKLARASRLPRVDLNGAYSFSTDTSLAPGTGTFPGFQVQPKHYAAGAITLSVPLFDGAGRRYTIAEAEERVRQLRDALSALENGVTLEVQVARLNMQAARAKLEVANRSVTAAEKGVEIAQLKAELGRAVQLEVLNARVNLEKALADRVSAINDLHLARARLDRALGDGPTVADPDEKPKK